MSIVLRHRTEKRAPLSLGVTVGFERLQPDIERDIDRWIDQLRSLKRLAR